VQVSSLLISKDKYFERHLNVSRQEANELHTRYYKDYGLAIEGMVRHHKVDALEYNKQVDDALPLENILSHNEELRQFLQDIDKSKVKMWLLTNAYVTHGKRVVKLLGVDDLFEGITFCDYGALPFLCKPAPDMYKKAMTEAGVSDVKDCFFVGEYNCTFQDYAETHGTLDDSALNATGAERFGWTAVHLVEPDAVPPPKPASKHTVRNLEELRQLFPQFFKSSAQNNSQHDTSSDARKASINDNVIGASADADSHAPNGRAS